MISKMSFKEKAEIYNAVNGFQPGVVNSRGEMVPDTYTKTVAHDAIVECVTDVLTSC